MRVLVTGAAGYIGKGLVAGFMRLPQHHDAVELLLTDRTPGDTVPQSPHATRWIAGDITDPQLQEQLFAAPVDLVFHLAGVVSGAAEADFALGKRVNLDATVALLERCRNQAAGGSNVARFVYASSIAVFGTPLPGRIDDHTAPAPTLSYGTHKRACELLIDDYTRRGFIDGRAMRLPGVVVRPALPNGALESTKGRSRVDSTPSGGLARSDRSGGALSAFNSDLIREPLEGRDYVCPVGREATVWLTSHRTAIANLLHLAEVDAAAIGPRRAVTAPALAASIGDIIDALGRVDPRAPGRVRCEAQPSIEAQFGRWPTDCAFDRAHALGLATDASLDALLSTYREGE